MTDTYFQLRCIQTSSRNAINKKLFLTSLLFLARSYRDVQHTNFRMSLKMKIVVTGNKHLSSPIFLYIIHVKQLFSKHDHLITSINNNNTIINWR
jgi:hypothetical protein